MGIFKKGKTQRQPKPQRAPRIPELKLPKIPDLPAPTPTAPPVQRSSLDVVAAEEGERQRAANSFGHQSTVLAGLVAPGEQMKRKKKLLG